MYNKDYEAYMIKLKFLKLDKYISITNDENNYTFKNLKYTDEFNRLFIPNFITCLGAGCCSGTNIEYVYLGSGIQSVGYGCFANCNKLKVIFLSNESQIRFSESLLNSNNAILKIKNIPK